jgi:hypothetical protein
MYVKPSDRKPVAARQTDDAGRFEFAAVPSRIPLQFTIRYEVERPDDYIANGDRMFNNGEVRENDRLTLIRTSSLAPNVRPAVPLAKSVEDTCRNVRAAGMRALVALLGDDSGNTIGAIDRLFADNNERTRVVLSYLTLRVDTAQVQKESATITEYGWPKPSPGEVVLVVLDGEQKTVAAQRIATKNIDAAVGSGADYLTKHRPAPQNALHRLAVARDDAKCTGRRVWIVEGGPRCGPCFRLARWMEDHHATLDKDYVIVKVMDGLHEHASEALAGLPIKPEDGIPWFAITESDGAVLVTSRGPLGNIGFPASVEEIRHFRTMLEKTRQKITADEVDRLVNSLSLPR